MPVWNLEPTNDLDAFITIRSLPPTTAATGMYRAIGTFASVSSRSIFCSNRWMTAPAVATRATALIWLTAYVTTVAATAAATRCDSACFIVFTIWLVVLYVMRPVGTNIVKVFAIAAIAAFTTAAIRCVLCRTTATPVGSCTAAATAGMATATAAATAAAFTSDRGYVAVAHSSIASSNHNGTACCTLASGTATATAGDVPTAATAATAAASTTIGGKGQAAFCTNCIGPNQDDPAAPTACTAFAAR